ncbi:MAG: hypothetical protein HND58_13930 [Planctomycetota bacterium]|nr:MAG: hypothetical protein HND58_13930 [Planctomycetota bacterium]
MTVSSNSRTVHSIASVRSVGPSNTRSAVWGTAGRRGSIVSMACPSARSRRRSSDSPKRAGSAARGNSSSWPMVFTPTVPRSARVSGSSCRAAAGSGAITSRCLPGGTTVVGSGPNREIAHAHPNVGAIAARACRPRRES